MASILTAILGFEKENCKLIENHSLFYFDTCPYCLKVRFAMKRLKIRMDMQKTTRSIEIESELINGGGKSQVPCLKITKPNGEVQWMYESDAIISYLKTLS